jgi:hypothetical protein
MRKGRNDPGFPTADGKAMLGMDERDIIDDEDARRHVDRSAARVALEHVDPKDWSERALNETDQSKALSALLALVRVSADDPQHHPKDCRPVDEALKNRILEALGRIHWDSLNEEQRLEWLRIFQILFNRMGRPHDSQRSQVIALLDPHYPAKSRFVMRVSGSGPTVGSWF